MEKGMSKRIDSKLKRKLYEDSKNGQFIAALTATFKDNPNLAKAFLPNAPFVLLSDAQKLLDDAGKLLLSLTKEKSVVMLERKAVVELLMSLGSLKNTYLCPELNDELEVGVRTHAKKLAKAAQQVRSILDKTKVEDVFYEDFQTEIDNTSDPNFSREVLNRFGLHPLIVHSDFGSIDFNLDSSIPRDLPSKDVHRVTVSLSEGFSDSEKCASVRIHDIQGHVNRLLKKGELCKLTIVKPEFRRPLLESQMYNRMLEVDVRIPRISIFPKDKVLPLLALVDIVSWGQDVVTFQHQERLDFAQRSWV